MIEIETNNVTVLEGEEDDKSSHIHVPTFWSLLSGIYVHTHIYTCMYLFISVDTYTLYVNRHVLCKCVFVYIFK